MNLLLSILLASAAWAQEVARSQSVNTVDCQSVRSATEELICGEATLLSMDEALAIISEAAGSEELLAGSERRWRRETRDVCASANCIAGAYNLRIREVLRGMSSSQRFLRDGEPGELIIAPVRDGLKGFLLLGLSPSEYVAIGGVTPLDRNAGEWAGGNGCTLVFRRITNGWNVVEDGECSMGRSADLAGDYRAVRHNPGNANSPSSAFDIFDAITLMPGP